MPLPEPQFAPGEAGDGLSVRNLRASYDRTAVWEQVSFSAPRGQITAITGHNGAGKTTLLRILMGLERPDGGTIDGLAGLRLSAVFQEDRLCDNLDPSANIRLINPTLGRRETEDALAAVGLAGCLRQPARELSGGMRRRVAILRALLAEYDLLFLDEPFKGLDRETKETVMADTRRRCAGRTVLLVTHDVAELDAMGAVVRLDLST